MATPYKTVVQTLTGFGTKEGKFSQITRGTTVGVIGHDEGYCNGVCLDWSRRVLQGGRRGVRGKVIYGGGESGDKVDAQVLRQATAQSRNLHFKEIRTAEAAKLNTLRRDLVSAYNACLNDPDVALPPTLLQRLHEYFEFGSKPNGRHAFATLDSVLSGLDTRREEQNNHTDASWSAIARSLDTYHRGERQSIGKGASSRAFSSIKMCESTPREYVDGGIAGAIGKIVGLGDRVMCDNVIVAGFGLRNPGGRDTGHAVAVYCTEPAYHFFDPNYGVFRYGSTGLTNALNYLFRGTHGTPPIYGEDGYSVLGNVSYVVFTERT